MHLEAQEVVVSPRMPLLAEVLADKLKDQKLTGMVNELLDACVKITEAWMLLETLVCFAALS